jgi:hypothetical protein
VDVTVTNAGGTSLKGSADHFSYVPAPLITKVTPNTGPGGGGTSVTIKGTGFVPGATVERFSGRMRLRHRGLYRALVKVSDGGHVSDYSEPILVR